MCVINTGATHMVVATHIISTWNGTEYVDVEITLGIDTLEIAKRLGRKAFENKSGKCAYIAGAVTATAKKVGE